MTKSELRKLYLARQTSLSPEERAEASLKIARRFFEGFDLAKIHYLHCFISIERFNEIDTKPIFERLWSEFPHVNTLVPRVKYETGEMESLTYGPNTELARNRWEIHEPSHDETVAPELIDMVLIPLVCFDARGHRVGYGKGFYDRFLAKCPKDCLKIGLSYFDPVEEIADAHDGDVRLDHCITPKRVYELSK